jgi:hypothetical protein
MNDHTTTKVSRSPLVSQPTEIQNAYNALAVAIKKAAENPRDLALQAAVETVRQNVYEVEDLYREGRKLRLAHVLDHPGKGLPL